MKEDTKENNAIVELRSRVSTAARSNNLSAVRAVPDELITEICSDNDKNFISLIQFFSHRPHQTKIIYTSMTIEENGGGRLGIESVLRASLP